MLEQILGDQRSELVGRMRHGHHQGKFLRIFGV
jgi:hypothetical protein